MFLYILVMTLLTCTFIMGVGVGLFLILRAILRALLGVA